MKSVAVIAIRHPEYDNLYLHGKRRDSGKFSIPGGHLESGEQPDKAALRELHEETGLKANKLTKLKSSIIQKPDGKKLEIHLFEAQHDDKDIPSADKDPDGEFESFHWIDPIKGANLHVPARDNVLVHHLNQKKLNKAGREDQITGGRADKKKPEDFDPEQLKAGQKIEREHTDSDAIAQEIAMDHLTEDSDYYKKLKVMESSDAIKPATKSLIKRLQKKSLHKTELSGNSGQLRKDALDDIADALVTQVPTMDRGDLAWHAENESSPKLMNAIYNHLEQSNNMDVSVLKGLVHNNNTPDDIVRKIINHSVSLPEDPATSMLLNTARRHQLPEDIKSRLLSLPHNQVQMLMAAREDLSDSQYDQLASQSDRWVHDTLLGNDTAKQKHHVIQKILDKSNDPRILRRTIKGGLETGALSKQSVHELAKKHTLKDHPKLINAIASVDGILPETLEHITNDSEIGEPSPNRLLASHPHEELLTDIAQNSSANAAVHKKILEHAQNWPQMKDSLKTEIAKYSTDPQTLHEIVTDGIAADNSINSSIVTRALSNPNTSADTIRMVGEEDPGYHFFNNTDVIAAHPNVPHDILKEIASNPEIDASTSHRLLSREDLHPEIAQILDNNPSPGLAKEKNNAGYGTLVHTAIGTNKLRQARDMAEANPDKLVHINDLKQAGVHPSDLGFMHLKEKGDKFHADKLHEHIQNQPKMSYGVSHTTYGEEPDISDPEVELEQHADSFDPSDYDVNKEDFLNTDKAREHHMDQFDPDQHVDRDDPKYKDAEGNFDENEYDADVESAHTQHYQDFDPEDYRHLVYEDEDFVNQRDYDRAHDRAYESHMDNFQSSGNSEEDAYNEALREQRHTHEPSKVFQLNVTPQHKARMKKEGVLDTFNRMAEASKYSSHPVHDNTIGWARYTESPDGIHVDEIQSDFGQSFLKQASQQAKSAAQRGELTPEQAEQAVKDASKKYPDDHFQKISSILFGGRHPNEVIHEAFLQHHRDQGNVGTPVHIWQPEGKAPISGMKSHDAVTWRDVENHFQDPNKSSNPTKSWLKDHKIKDLEHAKAKFDTQRNTFGEVAVKKPLPGHMQATYGQQPAKMGYKPSAYGKLQTQHNPDLKGQPTWESVIRKKQQYFANLAKNLKVRPKAPLQAIQQAKIDANLPPKPKKPSPIAVLSAQKAAKAKAKEMLGKDEKHFIEQHLEATDPHRHINPERTAYTDTHRYEFDPQVVHFPLKDIPQQYPASKRDVGKYATQMKRGSTPPAVVLLRDASGTIRVSDGAHRVEAARRAGLTHLPAYLGTPKKINKSELLGKSEELESLEKALPAPIRAGQLSDNSKHISVKNPFGGKDSFVWHNIQPIADAHDRDIKALARPFLGKQPKEYQPLMADFIKEHYNDPHRHIISDSPKGFKFRARHLKSLLSGDPSVKIKYTSPDSFEYSVERHNRPGVVSKGIYTRFQKGMFKNDIRRSDEYAILRRAIGETILEHGREGSQRHELGRIYSLYKNVRPEGCLRDTGGSGQPVETPWDGILSKSGPDEDQGPIRRFKNQTELEHHLSNNPFVMISAHNHERNTQENQTAHRNLVQDVLSRGYKLTPVLGRWNGSDEPSIMVHDMAEDDARELARKYGQYAHLQSNKGVHRDVSHSPKYKAMKPGQGHSIDHDLQDNYSVMELGDGSHAKFQLNLDNFDPSDKP